MGLTIKRQHFQSTFSYVLQGVLQVTVQTNTGSSDWEGGSNLLENTRTWETSRENLACDTGTTSCMLQNPGCSMGRLEVSALYNDPCSWLVAGVRVDVHQWPINRTSKLVSHYGYQLLKFKHAAHRLHKTCKPSTCRSGLHIELCIIHEQKNMTTFPIRPI